MKFDYPGEIQPQERYLLERFEDDVVPYLEQHGPWIGESAMQGDEDAEEVIRRYRLLIDGLPEMRTANYHMLVSALKRWDAKGIGRTLH